MSRRKEREQRKKEVSAQKTTKFVVPPYSSPFEHEVGDGKFTYTNKPVVFKGVTYPSHFEINANEYDVLQEGEMIGTSRLGQVLYWMSYMIVAHG